MTATTGIWNNAAASANPLMKPKAMEDTSGDSGDSSTSSATITANDFLTLLVTEMQNQDPTANTDPNEYIDQLVNVNSLEQLININQTLSAAYPTSTTSSSQAVTSQTGITSAAAAQKSSAHHAAGAAQANAIAAQQATPGSAPVTATYGNLGVQHARPAALRVARALDGQHITR